MEMKFTRADAYKYLGELALASGMAQIHAVGWSVLLIMRGQSPGQIKKFLEERKTPDGKTVSWANKAVAMAGKLVDGPFKTDEVKAILYPLTALQAHEKVIELFKAHRERFGNPSLNDFYRVCHFPEPCEASKAILDEIAAEKERKKRGAEPQTEDAPAGPPIQEHNRVEAAIDLFLAGNPAERREIMERIEEILRQEAEALKAAA